MKRRHPRIVWWVAVVVALTATAQLQAICYGSLYVASRSAQLLKRCPVPTLTKTWRIKCYNGCGYQTASFTDSLVGYGECFKGAYCKKGVVCLPISGSDVRGYNPPSLYSSIINRGGYYQFPPCQLPACRSLYVSTTYSICDCDSGSRPVWCAKNDPIIISLGDGHYQLTDRAGGVEFDLGDSGIPRPVSWTHPDSDDAFLVLDRNENGTVDNGTELFGDVTAQHASSSPNGFRALAVFDDVLSGGNEDGLISAEDEIFQDLQLWVDRNHNGFSEASELQNLSQAGLVSIELEFRESSRVDRYGNHFRYRGSSGWSNGERRIIWNVFLVAD